MSLHDLRGNPVSAALPAALAHYEQATDLFLGFSARAAEAADAAVAADPGFVMGHCLRASLSAIANEKTFEPQARSALEAAERLAGDANPRERGHIAALRAFLDGEWRQANAIYGEILIDHPRDTLALQVAHALDFYLGQSALIRDRIARVLPQWSEQVPGYGYLLGMYAFGLEEMGDYGRAEAAGREAVGRNRDDVWAIHAVSHVMEMQGRARDGIDWLAARTADWGAADNLFAIHNAWHLALFHLDLGQHDRVLALYEERIRAGHSSVALDLVDATAMLWRLHLRGVDVGNRWNELAEAWQASIDGGWYAFNDVHAMMSFVAAGRERDAERLLSAMAKRAENGVINAELTRDVGLPIARALRAFGRRDYATTIALLESVRLIAHRFGGSHAQRDVLHLTLTEAALRGGRANYARAFAAERLALKPTSPTNRNLGERARALDAQG